MNLPIREFELFCRKFAAALSDERLAVELERTPVEGKGIASILLHAVLKEETERRAKSSKDGQ